MESETHRRTRGPAHETALRVPLQIEREIRAVAPHAPEKIAERPESPPALEDQARVDGRMLVEQRGRRGLERPRDGRVGVPRPETMHERHGPDDVADRPEQHDQDPLRPDPHQRSALRSMARRYTRPPTSTKPPIVSAE